MTTRDTWQELDRALSRFGKVRLLVVGDLMQDIFIWGRVKRISPEAPVPVVEVQRQTAMLGGAANVVHNLVALGCRAAVAGVVGDDRAGKALLDELEQAGVDNSPVVIDSHRPTTVKTRIIAHHQQVVRFDREDRGPIGKRTADRVLKRIIPIIKKSDAVIISDYAKGVLREELCRAVIEAAVSQGKPVAVDPKVINMNSFRGATIVTPNSREAGEAAEIEIETEAQLEQASRIILQRLLCQAVLITRGEQGMSLFEKGRPPFHVPAQAREVFDVTGAGDTVIATLALGMAAGLNMRQAVKMANLAAGIVVGKLGTSVVTAQELSLALKKGEPRG